jgi:hypothetical protein
MAFNRGPQIVRDGLVLYLDGANIRSWDNSNPGAFWKDLTPFRNNAEPNNGPVFTTDKLGGFEFDHSVISHFRIPKTPELDFNPTDSFSLSVWAKVTFIESNLISTEVATILGRGSAATSLGIGMQRLINNTYRWSIGSRAVNNIVTVIPYTLGEIENITFTYTPVSQKIYQNGVLINEQSTEDGISGTFQNTFYALFINRAVPGGSGAPVSGTAYSAMIYNRELSSQEVLQNFESLKDRFL